MVLRSLNIVDLFVITKRGNFQFLLYVCIFFSVLIGSFFVIYFGVKVFIGSPVRVLNKVTLVGIFLSTHYLDGNRENQCYEIVDGQQVESKSCIRLIEGDNSINGAHFRS